MEFLKYFDFFNVKFHFYIGGQPSNNSRFGGVMNIIFFISCIITFLFFTLDDFKKLNPISSKSEIPGAELRVVNLHDSKIWIPWRMVTYEEKFVDHRGILYPIVSLIEGHWNNSFGMDLKYHTLDYKLCNETSMANKTEEYKIEVPLNELFCIDNDDIPWGGSWLGDILYYVEVNLYLCQNGIDFNATDPRCTKMTDLLQHKNTSWLFEFYFPVVQFQPANFNVPMAVIYRSYYYRLSTYANKVERIYVQENILSDDRNLIGTSYSNSSYWGVENNLYGDTYFMFTEKDPIVKSTSSRLYSLVIYMDQGFIYYTRSYKKIYSIISDIFPFLNLLLYLFKRVTRRIKLTYAKKAAAEILFENRHPKQSNKLLNFRKEELKKLNSMKNKKNLKIGLKNFSDNNLKNIFKINNETKEKLENKNSNSNLLNNNITENKSSLLIAKPNKPNSNNVNFIGLLNRNQMDRKKSALNVNRYFILDLSTLNKENDKKINSKKERNRDLFPFYYFFMDVFLDKLVRPKKFCFITKKYLIVYNFLGQIFDISSHILLFKHFNILKNLFLNELKTGENKFRIFNNNKKININDDNLMEEVNKDLKTQSCDIFTKTLLL